MEKRRLGCFTGIGVIASLVTFFAIIGVAFASGSQMFSAGGLNSQTGTILGGVGSHAEIVDCAVCHAVLWSADSLAERCIACHENISTEMGDASSLHGAILQKSNRLSCRECHTEHHGENGLLTIMNGRNFPHDDFGFSLIQHRVKADNQPIECSDCHGENMSIFMTDSCENCHAEMDAAFMKVHALTLGVDCLTCHNGKNKFDHDIAAFKLEGEHREAACDECHQNGLYKGTPTDCYSCHKNQDEHGGRFGTDCSACHTPSDWDNASFDHNRSSFPLTGAHTSVRCEDCHSSGQFAGLSSSCVSCHAEPQAHAGQFGTDCAACHTTTAWSPATFNGQHTFPLDHGEEGLVACATCHPSNYETYTCYGCHEHTEANIRGEHQEEGISDFSNCVECHADGREHDD